MNSDPLEIALDAQRPLPVELLLDSDKRRITVRDHERWMHTGRPPHEGDADLEGMLNELQTIERNHYE